MNEYSDSDTAINKKEHKLNILSKEDGLYSIIILCFAKAMLFTWDHV